MTSFQYSHPRIYEIAIKLTQNERVLSEFKRQVGENASVFDVAAGYGRMSKYIDSSNSYSGIDLNETSLLHAKQLGHEVKRGDIFDPSAYQKSDVIVLVDVVHHIHPTKLEALFDLVFTNAIKRVVILEPSFVNFESKYGIAGRYFDRILMKLDDDGINRIDEWFTKQEYEDLTNRKFNSRQGEDFSVAIQRISPYFIVTYSRQTNKVNGVVE